MRTLAIETATPAGSVAVVEDDAVLAELATDALPFHASSVLGLVAGALGQSGTLLSGIDRIAVGIGPGSFTGVRIGLSTAKGLSIATGIELLGVPSLRALAAAAVGSSETVVSVLDARRGEIYAAAYSRTARDGWIVAPINGSIESVARALGAVLDGDEPIVVIGDLDGAQMHRFATALGAHVRVSSFAFGRPTARFVAREAMHGRAVRDDDSLEPMYVRGADAKLPSKR